MSSSSTSLVRIWYIILTGIYGALFIITASWWPGTWAAPGYLKGTTVISGFSVLLFSLTAIKQLRLLGICGFIAGLLTMALLLMPTL